nr:uncharacterized protein LOC126530461 [Dermacentor andersoni]
MQMASTMSESTVFSVELLLDVIKQYPVLYDKSHPRYKKADYKKDIWKKISQDLGVTDGICQAKFKNLKDNFTKTKAKIRDKMKSGAAAKDVPTVKWKHFEALIPIMEKVYEEPIICSNIAFEQTGGSDKSAESGSRSQEDSQLELSLNEIHEVGWVDFEAGSSSHETPSSDTSETPQQTDAQELEVEAPNRSASRPRKYRRTSRSQKTPCDDDSGTLAVAAECLSHIKASQEKREQQKDVLHHFAHTMVGMLRTLPADDQFDIMHSVHNLVYDKIKEVRRRGNPNE